MAIAQFDVLKSKQPKIYNDPLEWWKKHESKFPNFVAALEKMYLSIQATSAPSERIFSVASRVLSKLRAAMGSDTASTLEYLHQNWIDWEQDTEVLTKLASLKIGQPKEG